MLIHDAISYWGMRTPDVPFVQSELRTVTWAQAESITNAIANALAGAGLQAGDRIAILGRNEAEVPLLMFGALKAGVVSVPLNARLAPPEWAYMIEDSQAKVVFASAGLMPRLADARPGLQDVKYWVTWSGEAAQSAQLDRWIAAAAAGPPPTVELSVDSDAFQLYTSGTTGRPKGAVLTHRGIQGSHLRCQLSGIRLDPGDVAYVFLPIALGGGVSMILNSWVSGATVRIADFSPAKAVAALDDDVAAVNTTPTMLRMMLEVEGVQTRDFAKLKWMLYAGSPAPLQLINRATEVFGCGLIGAFGQTEFFTCIALMPEEHVMAMNGREELLRSVGRPMPGIEVCLLDPAGEPVPAGTEGELCIRGIGPMREYWRDPEKTAKTSSGGWHHTGDIAHIDAEGYVYLLDRANDMIKSGGFSVYPREVERVIEALPGVSEVTVIGVPSEKWGEEVKAIVVRDPGSALTQEEVIAGCRGQLGGYKIPKTVDFVDELPLNANGKVLKQVLRARYRRD